MKRAGALGTGYVFAKNNGGVANNGQEEVKSKHEGEHGSTNARQSF